MRRHKSRRRQCKCSFAANTAHMDKVPGRVGRRLGERGDGLLRGDGVQWQMKNLRSGLYRKDSEVGSLPVSACSRLFDYLD